MNREILFRAKRNDWRELPKEEWWVEGLPCYGLPGKITEIEHWEDFVYCKVNEIDTETLCQYTGLRDKNGKRIWENDIIRDIEMGYQSVFFDSDIAGFALDDGKFENSFGEFYAGDCEVVGNIFDNAELLEQEN